jgi:hypothetical protein
MNRMSAMTLVLAVASMCGCSDRQAQPSQGSAAAIPVAQPQGVTRSQAVTQPQAVTRPQARAYVDPLTGELRAPTDAELAAEAAAPPATGRTAQAVRPAPAVTVTHLPNGMTEYDLGDAGRVRDQACVQRDGTVGACRGPAPPAAAGNTGQ